MKWQYSWWCHICSMVWAPLICLYKVKEWVLLTAIQLMMSHLLHGLCTLDLLVQGQRVSHTDCNTTDDVTCCMVCAPLICLYKVKEWVLLIARCFFSLIGPVLVWRSPFLKLCMEILMDFRESYSSLQPVRPVQLQLQGQFKGPK